MSSTSMDISETFRPEDLSKTDFFDFVTAPDLGIACDRHQEGAGSAEPNCSNGNNAGSCTSTSSNNNNNNNNNSLHTNHNAINQSGGGAGIGNANAIGSNEQAALQGFDQVRRPNKRNSTS